MVKPNSVADIRESLPSADRKPVSRMPNDPVNHPAHYTQHPSGVEAITITEAFSFNLGNAMKYIWRAGLKTKDATQDLEKAAWYLGREIQRLKRQGGE